MKLIRAHVDGFRLLSDIELDFSTCSKKNITVIRAANESGKTTMLTALQWGLLGDSALPKGYSLRRMDLAQAEPSSTRVEIEYEVDSKAGPKRYRVIRRSETNKASDTSRTSNVELYDVSEAGTKPLPSPNNHIQQHFPADLREVFFTDGDRALSFIEGAKSVQQDKVRNAIERMMGLSLLEMTIDHVKSVERQLRSRFDKEAGNDETRSLKEELERIEEKLPKLNQQLDEAKENIENLLSHKENADRDLENALKAGNRDELLNELANLRSQRKKLENQRKSADKRQADLLSDKILGCHLMTSPFRKAGMLLDDLRQKGQIPNKTIPILEDRLEHSDCICGESLDSSTQDGRRRREHIQQLIKESEDADNTRAKISDLYYRAKPLFAGELGSWNEQYSEAFGERQNITSVYKKIGEQEAEVEAKLDKIPDVNLQRLRDMKKTCEKKLHDEFVKRTEIDKDMTALNEKKVTIEREFRNRSEKISKGEKIIRNLAIATDIRGVVEKALNRMKTVEIKSVSSQMNDHFLSMIGADEARALITRAEITPEFRIVVYGRNDAIMDPSIDLNGASRRALTISFVLALTEISRVEAPNVIDTPLGMMAGFVKTEVLRTAADNSSQLILFLTHDEIKGCEDILDERAVVAATLTNPAHYPKILKNDPRTQEAKVLQCSCDHRSYCEICDRYESASQAESGAV